MLGLMTKVRCPALQPLSLMALILTDSEAGTNPISDHPAAENDAVARQWALENGYELFDGMGQGSGAGGEEEEGDGIEVKVEKDADE